MYDGVFLTNYPAFYKVNLYNQIAKYKKIFVIFISNGSVHRTDDFLKNACLFEYDALFNGCFEERSVIFTCKKIFSLLVKLKFKNLFIGGWDTIEPWFSILLSSKENNILVLESTYHESDKKGVKRLIKRIFLKKIGIALPAGIWHNKLLDELGYKGSSIISNGVGLNNFINKIRPEIDKKKIIQNRFLYVGRLSVEKNLERLVRTFNYLENAFLTVVGNGPLESLLKNISNSNIKFLSHIENNRINELYQSHDVLILPSYRETWSIVVEESLFFHLPVIISNQAGCVPELVDKYEVGIKINPFSEVELESAIKSIMRKEVFIKYYLNTEKIPFDEIRNKQIGTYLGLL